MKLKKFWSVVGAPGAPPPKSATVIYLQNNAGSIYLVHRECWCDRNVQRKSVVGQVHSGSYVVWNLRAATGGLKHGCDLKKEALSILILTKTLSI